MKSVYDTCTKDKVKVSYSLYAMLFELGLCPSSKGTIYLKEFSGFFANCDYIIFHNNSLHKKLQTALLSLFT